MGQKVCYLNNKSSYKLVASGRMSLFYEFLPRSSKILQLVANCLHQRAPLYLQELCVLVSAAPGRRHLRSADQFCLVVNRCRLSSMQRRGFAVAGPLAWNDLPVAVRVSIARNSYRTLIKTHLFNLAIKWRSGTVLEQSTRAPEKTLEGVLTKQVLITYIHTYIHSNYCETS